MRLDDALDALARTDERKARVVEMRFFAGLKAEEVAAVLKVSPDTVLRAWKLSRAWSPVVVDSKLTRAMTKPVGQPSPDWQKVEKLFHAALELQPAERGAFLDRECAGDGVLRRELDSLLAASGQPNSLFDRPAAADRLDISPILTPGSMAGPYLIGQRLGAGGMGEVFRAQDTRLGRDVALKTLAPGLIRDAGYLDRLRREARVLASLNHPNIATLYEVAELDGIPVLAMERVEGETLRERLSRAPFSAAEAVAMALQMTAALEAAHRKGIVHRDFKPGNVIVSQTDGVKVLDFGLAKGFDGAVPAEGPSTVTGAILGTAGYMAPEQALGKKVDTRADIFAFGAVLYEMLTARRAFEGDTAAATLTALLRDEPPDLETCVSGVPRDLSRIVRLCLRKDPDRRYQSITDVKLALEETQPDSVPPPLRNRTTTATAVWALVALAAVGGAWRLGVRSRPADHLPIVVTPVAGLGISPADYPFPALSPDGKMVAYSWGGINRENFDIYVRAIGSDEALRLTTDAALDTIPAWAPDGQSIAFSRVFDTQVSRRAIGSTSVVIVPVLGGPEKVLGEGMVQDWSPDGSNLLVLAATEKEDVVLVLMSAENGSVRQLANTGARYWQFRQARFSPDGRAVLFAQNGVGGQVRLSKVTIESGRSETAEIHGISSIRSFAWLPGGRDLLFFGIPRDSVAPRLYRTTTAGGQPQPLPFGRSGSYITTSPLSSRGAFVQGQGGSSIWRVGAWRGDDRRPQRCMSGDSVNYSAVVSPDGNQIAFSSTRSGLYRIWKSDRDGKGATLLTEAPGDTYGGMGSPVWSPDGTSIAFDCARGINEQIMLVSASGGAMKTLTEGNSGNFIPAWSPDGQWVYFSSERTGIMTIWRVSPAGGAAHQITKGGGYSVRFSPDGKFVYYLKSRSEGGLWRAPAEGGQEESLLPDFKSRNFWVLPDGVYLLDPGVTELSPVQRGRARFYRFRTKQVEDLGFVTDSPVTGQGIGLSPDGKWLYYSQYDHGQSNLMLVENLR